MLLVRGWCEHQLLTPQKIRKAIQNPNQSFGCSSRERERTIRLGFLRKVENFNFSTLVWKASSVAQFLQSTELNSVTFSIFEGNERELIPWELRGKSVTNSAWINVRTTMTIRISPFSSSVPPRRLQYSGVVISHKPRLQPSCCKRGLHLIRPSLQNSTAYTEARTRKKKQRKRETPPNAGITKECEIF
jgi:hypothetical protein